MVSLEDLGCTTTIGTVGCSGSALPKALDDKSMISWVWTNTTGHDSWHAYSVTLGTGYVTSNHRDYNDVYILCID